MRRACKLLILACTLWVTFLSSGWAQNPEVEVPAIPVQPSWMSPEDYAVQRAMVPLNQGATTGYFRNQKSYDSLLVWEQRGADLEEEEVPAYLDRMGGMLENYISQFRIDNFTRDVHLLWLIGRVKHRRGDTALAILYYQIAKMHDHGGDIPYLSLDSLEAPTRSDWVSIDEYYRLLEVRRRVDTLRPREVQQPMGESVNSSAADYAPFMHRSDSVLIFTSRRDTSGMDESAIGPNTRRNEDLYYSEFDIFSRGWQPAQRFDSQINSDWNEGSACLSPDGRILVFTRCEPMTLEKDVSFRLGRDSTLNIRRPRGFGDCDLYMAEYNPATQQFHKVQNLGAGINSEAWDSQPHVSADGKYLFFSSSRKNGYGGTDLYVSAYDSVRQKWGIARNLGPLINTSASEVTPFYHLTNETLYFSSTGHLQNEGGYDIFKTRSLGDRWELPHNLGPLINNHGNQYYFSISGDGDYIYYANALDIDNDHIRQNFDLYSFPMPMEARPDADAILKGMLRDSVTGYALRGKAMIIDLERNVEVTPRVLNDSGYFEFNLINDRRYRLYIVGEDFLTVNREFEMDGDTTFSIFTESFAQGKSFVFERLEFGSNSTKLNARLKPNLDYLARFLTNYPQFQLTIEGHTDSDGAPERNLDLSQRRAERIRSYLMRKMRVEDSTRIVARGYGETQPLVPNDTEENKSQNRRVEFQLIVNERYEGPMNWPSEREFYYQDNLRRERDPEFDQEFERMEGETEFLPLDSLELINSFDPEEEIEAQILQQAQQQNEQPPRPQGQTPATRQPTQTPTPQQPNRQPRPNNGGN